MGKAQRNRSQSARERIAAQQLAARQAEVRRRALIAGGSVFVVLAVVLAFVLIKTLSKSAPAAAGKAASTSTVASVTSALSSLPASEFNAIGAGPSNVVAPLTAISGQPLTSGGKPEMLYIGAEYCPFCAAERWAMATALSRFGTFSGLHLIRSASTDLYSNTATLSFYNSTYSSKYLVFTPVETTTVNKAVALQFATAAQTKLMNTYDVPPYISAQEAGAIPFVDIGNAYITDGTQYVPSVLGTVYNPDPSHFGLSWAQIAQDLKNPASPVAKAIIGSANHISAAICKITNGQPGNVCTSPAVTSISKI